MLVSVSSDFQNEPLSTHKRDGCSAEVVRLEDRRLEAESVRSCDTCDTAFANPISSSLLPPTPWASSVPLRPELFSHTQQSVLAPSA